MPGTLTGTSLPWSWSATNATQYRYRVAGGRFSPWSNSTSTTLLVPGNQRTMTLEVEARVSADYLPSFGSATWTRPVDPVSVQPPSNLSVSLALTGRNWSAAWSVTGQNVSTQWTFIYTIGSGPFQQRYESAPSPLSRATRTARGSVPQGATSVGIRVRALNRGGELTASDFKVVGGGVLPQINGLTLQVSGLNLIIQATLTNVTEWRYRLTRNLRGSARSISPWSTWQISGNMLRKSLTGEAYGQGTVSVDVQVRNSTSTTAASASTNINILPQVSLGRTILSATFRNTAFVRDVNLYASAIVYLDRPAPYDVVVNYNQSMIGPGSTLNFLSFRRSGTVVIPQGQTAALIQNVSNRGLGQGIVTNIFLGLVTAIFTGGLAAATVFGLNTGGVVALSLYRVGSLVSGLAPAAGIAGSVPASVTLAGTLLQNSPGSGSDVVAFAGALPSTTARNDLLRVLGLLSLQVRTEISVADTTLASLRSAPRSTINY